MSLEWSNAETIGKETVRSKVTQGVFHTVNRTAGFSTIDYGSLHPANLGVTEGLMFVGGASASTAAGIKVSTFMVIVIASLAIFSGKERTTVFGREIPRVNVQRAMAVASTAALAVLVLIVALFVVQPGLDFRTGMFEIISAFGTVGWSAGATPHLNEGAQIVLSLTMFAGRFGPITIALFMAGRERQDTIRYATERIRIG
jgi:trk system potassium uptake protein TrkH